MAEPYPEPLSTGAKEELNDGRIKKNKQCQAQMGNLKTYGQIISIIRVE